MRKKLNFGECRICGEYSQLTFEHVPPRSTFNNSPVTLLSGDELIKSVTDESKKPWEFSKNSGKIQQRGRGDYYLCGSCNNNTGKWYGSEYRKFTSGVHGAIKQFGSFSFDELDFVIHNIRPLPIFKQIMAMFCDINPGNMGDDSLKEFLLDKESKLINRSRYEIYAYIHSGSLIRSFGLSALLIKGIPEPVMVSEISGYPIGLALYVNKPKDYIPMGCNITSLCEYDYEEQRDVKFYFPKLENNTMFPADYRTKEEIICCIEQSKNLQNI